jgi:hypothetical protein
VFSASKRAALTSDFTLPLDFVDSKVSAAPIFECLVAGPWLLNSLSWLEQMKNARELNKQMYFSRFPASIGSLSNYLTQGPIENPNQILFLIVDQSKSLYGHVGLKVNSLGKIEIDNVLRISTTAPGIMKAALNEVMKWGQNSIGITEYQLQVISTNIKAISFYDRLGFHVIGKEKLKIVDLGHGITNLVPTIAEFSNTFEELILMKKKF